MAEVDNVKVEVKGNIMTLTVDLSKDLGVSSSGKSHIVASSRGNAPVPGKEGMLFGLNVYKKA